MAQVVPNTKPWYHHPPNPKATRHFAVCMCRGLKQFRLFKFLVHDKEFESQATKLIGVSSIYLDTHH